MPLFRAESHFDEVYGRLFALGVTEFTEDHHVPIRGELLISSPYPPSKPFTKGACVQPRYAHLSLKFFADF